MSEVTTLPVSRTDQVLLGDEAVALGAIHAGLSGAYAYPGTPSTEILEFLLSHRAQTGTPVAAWCTNEKTAYEQALGMSMAGKRALVAMKHVGLNVAADPFMNSAIVRLDGGLVLAVADDPGMHSSQNEQDSRYFADFARVICLEPADQQEAYEMTRQAFALSESFHVPVVLRLVTRLAHSRAPVRPREPIGENRMRTEIDKTRWILLPGFARRLWSQLVEAQDEMRSFSELCDFNTLSLNERDRSLGVITTGIARNYLLENVEELEVRPSHLHIGAYPAPLESVRKLMSHARKLLVLEEGYPYVERMVRGVLDGPVIVQGKQTGEVPQTGELTPDNVREALELKQRAPTRIEIPDLPARPPQLCRGCPHGDAYEALGQAMTDAAHGVVTSDIGCYTLGVLPPFNIGESCVCMGASIGMAKGAADAGMHPVVAVIGDSTFLHSGVTPLMDAVAADSDMTVLVLDNRTVAMTGTQPTVLPSPRLVEVIRGIGVDPEHVQVMESHPRKVGELASILRREIAHRGLSVVVVTRECLESAKKRKTQRG